MAKLLSALSIVLLCLAGNLSCQAFLNDAVRKNDIERVQELLSSVEDTHGEALSIAAAHGHLDIAALLLEKGSNIDGLDGREALHEAAAAGHAEMVILLLSYGADVNHLNRWESATPLFYAVCADQLETARLLLQAGAKTHNRNAYGENALLVAAARENFDICRLLLEYGAYVDDQDTSNGNTPLV